MYTEFSLKEKDLYTILFGLGLSGLGSCHTRVVVRVMTGFQPRYALYAAVASFWIRCSCP